LFALLFASVPAISQSPVQVPAGATGPLITVPALTPVIVRIGEEVSSKIHKPGDQFPITVAEDVRIAEAVVIPAGSVGVGEVIHAAKPGAGGKAGELILAARFLQVADNQVRLRSFALGVAGKDNSETALATSFVIGPFAMFVRGGAVVVPRDTLGIAKTALEFKLPAVTTTPAMPTVVKGGEDESKTD
jgi:hypothetical protein